MNPPPPDPAVSPLHNSKLNDPTLSSVISCPKMYPDPGHHPHTEGQRKRGNTTGGAPGRDPIPKGVPPPPPLYRPQNCRTEQCALSAPEAPQILF